MTITEQMNKRIKARKRFNKRLLWRIRWELVKDNPTIWYLLLVALVFPVIPFNAIGLGCTLLHPIRVILDNVCYGYIAGMIFYLFSDFRPISVKIFKSKQRLSQTFSSVRTNFVIIADALNAIDSKGEIVDNYEVVAKRTVIEKQLDEEHIIANNGSVSKIKACAELTNRDISDTQRLYQDVLTEDECKHLDNLSHVFDKLMYSSLSGFVSSPELCIDIADLEYFLSDFHANYEAAKRMSNKYKAYRFDSDEFNKKNPVDE